MTHPPATARPTHLSPGRAIIVMHRPELTSQEHRLIDRLHAALHTDDLAASLLVRAHLTRLAVNLRHAGPDALGDLVRAVEARQNATVL